MTIQQLKQQKEDKVSELLKNCLVFFAFSNEQFDKNKTPLQEGEKYVSIGAGGYMPKGKLKAFNDGMDEINAWYKNQVKARKLRKKHIVYELYNHEAFYTCDITDTLRSLGEDFTEAEVLAVYREELKKQPA